MRFDNKESACSAIVAVHGTQIAGQIAKCSWGKENPNGGPPTPAMGGGVVPSGNDYYGRGGAPTAEAVHPDQLQYYQQQQQQYYAAYMYNPQQYMQYYAQQQQYGGGGGGGYGGYPQQAPPPPPNH